MLMNLQDRVKLSLLLVLLMLVVWQGLHGCADEEVLQGRYVEWPEYAAKHLLQSLPVETAFTHPIQADLREQAYLAKAFGEDNSTGEFWKLEPAAAVERMEVMAMGAGLVLMAEQWGSDLNGVVVLLHRGDDPSRALIESMCAGLDTLEVRPGQWIKKGDRLGVISNAKENALQLEIRETLGLGIGPGNLEDSRGWLRPDDFLKKNGKR